MSDNSDTYFNNLLLFDCSLTVYSLNGIVVAYPLESRAQIPGLYEPETAEGENVN
ncbi:hypothetical protein GCM10007096_25430 [Pullulanibacillus pueri]|uniref:Uncharacterized protein n=1 Tax=Pullulanibacillus pueri TaxID=1437324 RepID=A0A8J2ZX98_9BACL|nr:hypothetical protein GCM10007096_25430 [Pullulanibacillus pueri]